MEIYSEFSFENYFYISNIDQPGVDLNSPAHPITFFMTKHPVIFHENLSLANLREESSPFQHAAGQIALPTNLGLYLVVIVLQSDPA